MWSLEEALEWKFLPGDLLDQPEALMNDLMIIAWRRSALKELMQPAPSGTPAGQVKDRVPRNRQYDEQHPREDG